MSSSSDDKAQGQGGEGKRPYATLDLKATEIEQPAQAKADTEAGESKPEEPATDAGVAAKPEPRARGGLGLISHLAAGVAGAAVVLVGAELLVPERAGVTEQKAALATLTRRIADLESAVGGRPGAESVRARLDEIARTLASLGEVQAQLKSEARSLDARVGTQDIPQGLAERLTKIDEILATVPGSAGREQTPAAKALVTRVDTELSELRTEAGRLAQRIDTLRGEVDERLKGAARASDVAPLAAKVASMERDVQTFTRSEADRNANASRIVLLLELGNLKRGLDTGKPYPAELAAVQKVAQGRLKLQAIERYATEGVPPIADLVKSFRTIANRIIDAETQPADGSIVDRLVAGAKSVVRVRKSGHAPDDKSAEAIVGRMEIALKEGRLAEVLAQGRTLPPKAALAAEDWLKRVEARQAVDAAVADIETQLKTSLGEAQK